MFSVLMSVYKNEKPEYLKECLESIVTQTQLPNEIVIVKDGPLTEELDEVIEAYKIMDQELFVIVALKENLGLGKALAEGIKYCKHEIIARMDSDDIAVEDRFEKQLKVFKENNKIDLVGGSITEFEDNKNNIVSIRKVPLTQVDIRKYAKKRNPFNHVTVMYKKDAVLKSGNYRKVSGMGYEDYDLWIRMLMNKYNCINIDETLVYVRVGKDMYKRRGDKERLITALKFRYKMYKDGFSGVTDFLIGSSSNIIVAFIPNKVRELIYKKILRN